MAQMNVNNEASTEMSDKLLAWANIKDSHKTKQVLYAQAVGIENIPVNNKPEECLKLNYHGYFGYLPITLIDDYKFRGLQNLLGKEFEFVVEHLDMESQLFVANRIEALNLLSKKFWKTVQEGQVYDAFIRGVDPFNLFLLVEGVPTKMYRDEFSYSFFDDLREVVQIGDVIQVQIMKAVKPGQTFIRKHDNGNEEELTADENGHLEVSSRVLREDPWNNIVNYKERCTYLGTITNVHFEHGLFIELEPGLALRANFPPRTNGSLLRKGQQVNVKITAIDAKNREIKAIIIDPTNSIGQKRFGTRRRGMIR